MESNNTVTGSFAPGDPGFTLMHEHVLASASGLYDRHPGLFFRGE